MVIAAETTKMPVNPENVQIFHERPTKLKILEDFLNDNPDDVDAGESLSKIPENKSNENMEHILSLCTEIENIVDNFGKNIALEEPLESDDSSSYESIESITKETCSKISLQDADLAKNAIEFCDDIGAIMTVIKDLQKRLTMMQITESGENQIKDETEEKDLQVDLVDLLNTSDALSKVSEEDLGIEPHTALIPVEEVPLTTDEEVEHPDPEKGNAIILEVRETLVDVPDNLVDGLGKLPESSGSGDILETEHSVYIGTDEENLKPELKDEIEELEKRLRRLTKNLRSTINDNPEAVEVTKEVERYDSVILRKEVQKDSVTDLENRLRALATLASETSIKTRNVVEGFVSLHSIKAEMSKTDMSGGAKDFVGDSVSNLEDEFSVLSAPKLEDDVIQATQQFLYDSFESSEIACDTQRSTYLVDPWVEINLPESVEAEKFGSEVESEAVDEKENGIEVGPV